MGLDLTVSPASTVVVLVPRRADGGHRDRLWSFAREWWLSQHPDWPVVEGDHDDGGPFNRSAAINLAARKADELVGRWDVALIIDADIIANPEAVRAIIEIAHNENRMAVSHNRRVMLSQPMTERILDGYRGSWEARGQRVWTDSCSCCIAVSRTLWDRVGGFDEGYVGWGYEDSAFGALAIHHGGPIHYHRSTLFHLWHPESPDAARKSPVRQANEQRLRALHARLREAAKAEHDTIPAILHRTVPAETTPEVEAWWAQFAELHPNWDLRTYREPIDPALFPITSPVWSKCQNGAQKAGLIRLEALVTWGGVYVDSDVEPLRPFDPLLPLRAFAGWEDETTIPDAVLGARPHHEAFEAALRDAVAAVRKGRDAWTSGPGVTTRRLRDRYDVTVLPPGAFYPYHYLAKAAKDTISAESAPWAFCAHHWHHSWGTDAQRRSIAERQR